METVKKMWETTNKSKLTRQELNEQIALHFGFSKTVYENIEVQTQWRYPINWYLQQCVEPNYTTPDFIEILTDSLKQMQKWGTIVGPMERFNK